MLSRADLASCVTRSHSCEQTVGGRINRPRCPAAVQEQLGMPPSEETSWNDSSLSLDNPVQSFGQPAPLFHSERSRVFFVAVCCLVFLVSFFGNCFVVVHLAKSLLLKGRASAGSSSASTPRASLSSFSDSLFLNVSIVYLLLHLLAFVPNLLYFVSSSWRFGQIGCKLTFYIENVGFSTAIWTMLAISFESTRRHWLLAPVVLSSIWLLSLLLHLPHVFTFKLVNASSNDDQQMSLCILASYCVYVKTYSTFGFVVGYLLPVLVLAGRLLTTMLRRVKEGPWAFEQRRRDTLPLLVATGACFAIGLLPYQVRILWATWSHHDASQSWNIFVVAAYLLAYLTCAIHPILLILLSPPLTRSVSCAPDHARHDQGHELNSQDSNESTMPAEGPLLP